VRRIGFVVNPIAGMGGRVGLKGTDGVANEAQAAGAEPVAGPRAEMFARTFLELSKNDESLSVRWISCAGAMGVDALRAAGVTEEAIEVVHIPGKRTTAADTRKAVDVSFDRGAELLLFCGGDGTARDIAEATKDRIPILGIPAGVKMHSGLFAVSPLAAAHLLVGYLRGQLRAGSAEILDVDEEAYRTGVWRIRLFATAKTLVEPNLVAAGKAMVDEMSQEAILGELAVHFSELFESEPETLFLLGPGSTLDSIATAIGLEKTLLGVDAALRGKTIAKDLNEKGILELLDRHPKAKLVVSPIGAQGFILGRGNLQVSPTVLRRIGTKNVIVVATPAKLAMTPVLRVDTGDPSLDEEFHKREYLFVLIGYRTSKLHPIQR
jgi:predicted polyphosphate/ATP-dependent NAD kinase